MIGAALGSAGKTDRDLRASEGNKPQELALSASERLGLAIGDAFADHSTHERHRMGDSPDGLVYYSVARRGKTSCMVSGVPGGSAPVSISCPEGAGRWKEY